MQFVSHRLSNLLISVASATMLLFPASTLASDEVKLTLLQLNQKIKTLDKIYSTGAIQSAIIAEKAIDEASETKNDLQKWYLQAEQACAEKFFVTSCLNDIKLVRRDKLSILQRITIEAKAWQRKQRIEQLDLKLQERNEQK